MALLAGVGPGEVTGSDHEADGHAEDAFEEFREVFVLLEGRPVGEESPELQQRGDVASEPTGEAGCESSSVGSEKDGKVEVRAWLGSKRSITRAAAREKPIHIMSSEMFSLLLTISAWRNGSVTGVPPMIKVPIL
jgi:hypothetical protein